MKLEVKGNIPHAGRHRLVLQGPQMPPGYHKQMNEQTIDFSS